jgi:hypothetical protein
MRRFALGRCANALGIAAASPALTASRPAPSLVRSLRQERLGALWAKTPAFLPRHRDDDDFRIGRQN